MDPTWPSGLQDIYPLSPTSQTAHSSTDQYIWNPSDTLYEVPVERITPGEPTFEWYVDHAGAIHQAFPMQSLSTSNNLGMDPSTELFSYSALSRGSNIASQYSTALEQSARSLDRSATGSQPTIVSPARQLAPAFLRRSGTTSSVDTLRSNPAPSEEARSFSSIYPTATRNVGPFVPSAPQTEESMSKRHILGILYPVTRNEIEAGGHVGFGKARIEISLERPCTCPHIDNPILWVLTPDSSVQGICSYPERTWLRIESRLQDKEILRSNPTSSHFNIVHDLDKTRRNTHDFFQDVKVKIKVKARTKSKGTDEPGRIDSLHTPIAAAFTYVYTWEHRGHCSGMTASKYFSVGITNAKPHLSTVTEDSRKRRRTGSPAQPSNTSMTSEVPSSVGIRNAFVQTGSQVATSIDTTSPDSVSKSSYTREAIESPVVHHQTNSSLNGLVLFLSGRSEHQSGLTDPTLTAEYDADDHLRLHSISVKSGPGILTLSGTSGCIWLQFVCDFARFLPILMQIDDIDKLRPAHRTSVINQLYFLHRVLRETNASDKPGREHELIKSWMNVLGMIRSHCDANHEVRFDCLLVLNQEVLNDIMIAEENNFVPNLPVDPSDIQYLAGLIYSECLRTWKPIIGMASRRVKSWEQKWSESRSTVP